MANEEPKTFTQADFDNLKFAPKTSSSNRTICILMNLLN